MGHPAVLVLPVVFLAVGVLPGLSGLPGGVGAAGAQQVIRNIPYVAEGHERQVLDVQAPAGAKNLPVVFWIHGGGWQTGDKTQVAEKPRAFTDAGFVFVSMNHRLLPSVEMGDIIRDVAKAMRWTHDNIAKQGGDPTRVLVMGHSSGGRSSRPSRARTTAT